jgi:transcriptional regulator with XRE-family HTH domain
VSRLSRHSVTRTRHLTWRAVYREGAGVLGGEDTVASRLRTAIQESGMSVRDVARRLAGVKEGWGPEPERKRRKIYNWLGGVIPEEAASKQLSRTFNLPADHFIPSELELLRRKERRQMDELEDTQAQIREQLAAAAEAAEELGRSLDQQDPSSEQDSPRQKPE